MIMNESEKFDVTKLETPADTITRQHHQTEISLMVEILNVFLAGFNKMGTVDVVIDERRIILLELIMSFHALLCACRLSISGFYAQGMSLLRQITENWMVCATCKNDEHVREHILTGEGNKLNYYQLAKSLGVLKSIYADYKLQSKFTHGTNISLGILRETDLETVRVLPTYEKLLFLSCAEAYFKYSYLMLDQMHKLLTSLSVENATKWDKETGNVASRIETWQKTFREEYRNSLEMGT